jgi:hypothetical protein
MWLALAIRFTGKKKLIMKLDVPNFIQHFRYCVVFWEELINNWSLSYEKFKLKTLKLPTLG